MVPNPFGLYDDHVRARTLWSLREGLVVAGILLFWAAVAVVLSVVLLVLSVPFAVIRYGVPGLPVAGLIWTLVGPLAFLNAMLYVLVRAGTVVVDHYRSDQGSTFETFVGSGSRTGRTRATDDVDAADVAEAVPEGESDGAAE